jgi:hypothetical protein
MDYLYDDRRRGGAPLVIGIIVVILLVVYFGGAIFFRKHLIPGSIINGVNCSAKSIDGAKKAIREEVNNYTLKIIERENYEESIKGDQVGIEVEFDSEMDKLYDMQKPLTWPVGIFKKTGKNVGVTVSVNDQMFNDAVDGLECFSEDRMRDYTDATVTASSDATFAIIPEDIGTKLDKEKVSVTVKDAIIGLSDKLDLDKAECYINPSHYAEDEEVIAACDMANKFTSCDIKFVFGDETYDLSPATIADFIKINPNTFKVNISPSPILSRSVNNIDVGSPRCPVNTACEFSPPIGNEEPYKCPTPFSNTSSTV